MKLVARIKQIVEPVLEKMGTELIEATLLKKGGRLIVCVVIDKEAGVKLDTCSEASGRLSAVLDEAGITRESYSLEVSSPGTERPLTKIKHLRKFIGSKVKIRTKEAINNRKNFITIIEEANEDNVVVSGDEKQEIPYENILQAKLKVDIKFG